METKRVYVGYLKNSYSEKVLYQIDDNSFIDVMMKDKIVYYKNDLDLETLIPLNITLEKKCICDNKFFIRKCYNHDRAKVLDTSNIYIGNLAEIVEVKEWEDHKFDYRSSSSVYIKKFLLLKRYMDKQKNNKFINVLTNEDYNSVLDYDSMDKFYRFIVNKNDVDEIKSLVRYYPDILPKEEKRLVLERYRYLKSKIEGEK